MNAWASRNPSLDYDEWYDRVCDAYERDAALCRAEDEDARVRDEADRMEERI